MSRCAGWAWPFPRTGGAPKRRRGDYTALLCGPMKSRAIVPLLALTAAGCGGGYTVPPDKVEGAIRSLGYQVRFRDVEQPPRAKIWVGRLRDPRTGTAVDFRVLVGEGSDDEPIIPGAGWHGGGYCAGAGVRASGSSPDKAERERMWDMGAALEKAILALAPEAYCEG